VSTEIHPGSDEFDVIAEQLKAFLDNMDTADLRRIEREEASFRQFCVFAVSMIAAKLGFVVTNIAEFAKDMAWAAKTGWQEGIARARGRRFRPDGN
jgi:hypothetical protein